MSAPAHMSVDKGETKRAAWLSRLPLPVLCIVLACPFVLLSTLYYDLPLLCVPELLLIELGGTIGVGRLCLWGLHVDRDLPSAADLLALSHILGYGLSLVLYVVLFLLAPHELIGPVYLGVSVVGLCASVLLMWGDARREGGEDPTRRLVLVFFAVLLGVYTITFVLPNYLPTTQANSYYLDNVFWVGNNVELTYSVPPDNFRNVIGPDIRYHYISSVRMALIQTAFGVPAFEACWAYSTLDLAIMLASASVMFVRELSDDREVSLPLGLLAFLLLFSTGFERATSMSFLSHLYVASFGFGESFSFMLVFLALAKRYWERGELSLTEALLGALVLALCMGSKGTLGFICMLVTAVLCGSSLWRSERRAYALRFGLSALVAGVAVYFLLLSEGIWRNVGEVSNVRSLLSFPRTKTAYDLVCALPLPRVLREGIFLVGYAVACHPVLYGLAFVSLIQGLRARRVDWLDVGLWLGVATCLGILRFVDMKGFSQSYFYMATIPLLWAYVARRLSAPTWLREGRGTFVVGALAAVLTLGMGYKLWLPKLAVKDMLLFMRVSTPSGMLYMPGFEENVVTPEAYKTLIWVRDNLPEDALYMCDVYDTATRNTYYPGSISARHIIEQWNLYGMEQGEDVPSIFQGDEGALERCREVGISYLIQISNQVDLATLYPNDVEILYQNGPTAVYRLR